MITFEISLVKYFYNKLSYNHHIIFISLNDKKKIPIMKLCKPFFILNCNNLMMDQGKLWLLYSPFVCVLLLQ